MKKLIFILVLLLLAACTKVQVTDHSVIIGEEPRANATNITDIQKAIVNYDTPNKVINDALKETEVVDFGDVV